VYFYILDFFEIKLFPTFCPRVGRTQKVLVLDVNELLSGSRSPRDVMQSIKYSISYTSYQVGHSPNIFPSAQYPFPERETFLKKGTSSKNKFQS